MAEYLVGQLEIADASCLKLYGERDGAARTHAGEIEEAGGWRDFTEIRVAEEIAVNLRAAGIGCEVEHRHIDRPILQK